MPNMLPDFLPLVIHRVGEKGNDMRERFRSVYRQRAVNYDRIRETVGVNANWIARLVRKTVMVGWVK